MKKKPYFIGGAVNTGISTLGQMAGMNAQDSQLLGSVGQLATGALTGNPADLVGGGVGLVSSAGQALMSKQALGRQQQQAVNDIIKNNMAKGGKLVEFNGGFKHSDMDPRNIYEGIPMGMAPDNSMNTVENGETMLEFASGGLMGDTEKFVFSEQLKVDDEVSKKFGLPKGKSYAELSKQYQKTRDNWGDDKWAKDTFDMQTQNLMAANNYAKDTETLNQLAKGGKININPENRGKFTASANSAGMGVQEFAKHVLANRDNYSSTQVKRANFARNAAKWHHAEGGELNPWETGWLSDQTVTNPILGDIILANYNAGDIGMANQMAGYGNPDLNTKANTDLFNARRMSAPTSQSTVAGNNPNKKFLNIAEIMQNMSPEERRTYAQKLAETKNPFEELTKQGYTPGGKGVSWQHGQEGLFGGVTPEIINQVTNPALLNSVFGEAKDSYTKDDLARLQRAIENDPTASQYVVDPSQRDFGVDWLVASSMGPNLNMDPLEPKTALVDNNVPFPELEPIPGQQPKDPDKPKKDYSDWMRYAPLAGAALAMAPLPEAANYDPATYTAGYLRPQMADEMTARAGLNSGFRGSVGALADMTGGSTGAMRAGLLGLGATQMGATSNAFTQMNQANNAARMAADQFNIGTQGNVAAANTGILNDAARFNEQNRYARDIEQYDTRLSSAQEALNALGQIGTEKDWQKMYGNVHGYDKYGQYLRGQNQASCGGSIKTKKRSLL